MDETALQSEDEQKAATSAAFQRWLAQRHQPAPARPALLDELNRQQWQLLGEVAAGFLEDGLLDTLEHLPKALLETTEPVQLYRLAQLLRRAAANPQGFWVGLKEIEWERLQAVLAKLKELTTTPRGAGELLFDIVSIWLGGEALTAFKESELGIKLAAGLKGAPKPPAVPKRLKGPAPRVVPEAQVLPVEPTLSSGGRIEPEARSLTDIQTRDWYHGKLAEIDEMEAQMRVDGKSAEEIFWTVSQLRNTVKMQARDLMKNQALAKSLPPPKSPKEMLKKYNGDYEEAIAAAKRSNAAVNNKIEGRRVSGEQ